ncbi:hypothetical protein [Pseudaminobacter soli (ex Li et al. 2025)]|uniref:hypothetical protein n=1 Tax=Pseudaminobacter soli (ex Li et al. 2025) TaxID=1295366 RepID=UPI001FE0C7B4|nr:hypothetical protein [Mesorhizobium soli]
MYHQTIAIGSETHPLQRLRYQLMGGLLLAVGLPLVARMALEPRIVLSINHQVTITAAIIAHMTGYMTYKRLDAFPGVATFSTILPAFTLSYGLVFLAIFFFRFEYSRFQAAGSFFISASWYFSSTCSRTGWNLTGWRSSPAAISTGLRRSTALSGRSCFPPMQSRAGC